MYPPQYDSKTNIPSERKYRVGITGTGASTPTKRAGAGVTVSRTGAGVIKFSFDENPGTFVGIEAPCFGADTPSGVKGYSVSRDTYTAPSGTTDGYIEVSLWDASNNAVDLNAAQYLDLTIVFSEKTEIT